MRPWPADDPDANPTERLWQVVRAAVTQNHRHTDPWERYHDVDAFFDALDADQAHVALLAD